MPKHNARESRQARRNAERTAHNLLQEDKIDRLLAATQVSNEGDDGASCSAVLELCENSTVCVGDSFNEAPVECHDNLSLLGSGEHHWKDCEGAIQEEDRTLWEVGSAETNTAVNDDQNDRRGLDDDLIQWEDNSSASSCNIEEESTLPENESSDISALIKQMEDDASDGGGNIFQCKIAHWALRHNVTHHAIDDLLCILKDNGYPSLPKNAKTLLRTPRSTAKLIKPVGGGLFWYCGIFSSLEPRLTTHNAENTVEIDVFVDGLSPYNSVKRTLWPIAGCLVGKNDPFIIAIWCGSLKQPDSLNEYLEDFVKEAEEMMNGFTCNNKEYYLKIRNFIADAPARAWIRQVKQHGSSICCERCEIKGEWLGRMTYNVSKTAPLRTDESFLAQSQAEYHYGVSPLHKLGIKMISQFPLDSMHLVYLGVMKRLLAMLLLPKASKHKLKPAAIGKLSNLMMSLAPHFPSDFARKPRALNEWKNFKATELRRILLYDGVLIFQNVQKSVYNNFLLLHCAIRILCDPSLQEFLDDADKLLQEFVKHAGSPSMYGQEFVVYNVHHLLHLVEECKLHGTLEEFSAFKYENSLGSLKNLLHAPGKTLPQIVGRLMERAEAPSLKKASVEEVIVSQRHFGGPLHDLIGEQYRKIERPGLMLRLALNDACCKTCDGEVLVVQNIVKLEGHVRIVGRAFRSQRDYFTYPFASSILGIFQVKDLGPVTSWPLAAIMQKCILLPVSADEYHVNRPITNTECLCIPLLHSA